MEKDKSSTKKNAPKRNRQLILHVKPQKKQIIRQVSHYHSFSKASNIQYLLLLPSSR